MREPQTILKRAINARTLVPNSTSAKWERDNLAEGDERRLFDAILYSQALPEYDNSSDLLEKIADVVRYGVGYRLAGTNNDEPSCTSHAHEWMAEAGLTHKCSNCGMIRTMIHVRLYQLPTKPTE